MCRSVRANSLPLAAFWRDILCSRSEPRSAVLYQSPSFLATACCTRDASSWPHESRRSVPTGECSRVASARKRYALGVVRIPYFEVQIADFSAVSTDGAMYQSRKGLNDDRIDQ